MKAELRRGHRRYAGTARGDQYQRVLVWQMDTDAADPRPHERTVGDLVAPERTGQVVDAVNVASKHLGTDAADWSIVRLLAFLSQVDREARAED